jgi:endonuclease YncB( thermonuclease family)
MHRTPQSSKDRTALRWLQNTWRRGRDGRRPAWRALGGLVLSVAIAWLGARLVLGAMAFGGSGGRWSPSRTCTVMRVLDGDSLRLRCGVETLEARLHCIDAPEWEQGTWGKSAMRSLARLARGAVEIQTIDTDRYGRAVINLYGTGPGRPLINLEQVAGGQAAVYHQFCDDPRFDRAEREARRAGRGIWSRPGEQQRPWEFRRHKGN